jgi:hypothetical protein
MQSFENTPLSPTKRLGVSLNVDTGYKGKAKEISPPQTPKTENPRPSKGNITAANRALRVRTGLRETFLDDITPVDPSVNKENDPQKAARANRDSHDLSLSPRQVTRDSLVDHMLLSLDQFSFGHEGGGFGTQPTVEEEQLYSAFGDEEPYQPTSNFAARNGRGIGHTYSYSSDYDNADDSSRYSGGQLSRGRRSNSSSNFQPGLGRLNLIRVSQRPADHHHKYPHEGSTHEVERAAREAVRIVLILDTHRLQAVSGGHTDLLGEHRVLIMGAIAKP